jgi:hypothetical protein
MSRESDMHPVEGLSRHEMIDPVEETQGTRFPVRFGVIGALALIILGWMIVDFVVR